MNQPPTPTLSKGLDLKMMLAGLAVVGIGVAALAVGLFTSYGLRLGPLPIPLSLVGPVIAAVGGVAMYLSTSQLKCDACRVPLTLFTAWFPVEDEAVVVEALHHDPRPAPEPRHGQPEHGVGRGEPRGASAANAWGRSSTSGWVRTRPPSNKR